MAKPERVEENKFVRLVKFRGWINIKQQTKGPYGTRGYNDQLILADYGTHVMFEFKKKGEKPTPIQRYRHKHLKLMGHKSYVVTKATQALRLLEKEIEENAKALYSKKLSRDLH